MHGSSSSITFWCQSWVYACIKVSTRNTVLCECHKHLLLLLHRMPMDLFNGFHFTMCVPFRSGNVLLRWLFPLFSYPFHSIRTISSPSVVFDIYLIWKWLSLCMYFAIYFRSPPCRRVCHSPFHKRWRWRWNRQYDASEKRKQKETCWTEKYNIGANANASEVFAQRNWWCTYIPSLRIPHTIAEYLYTGCVSNLPVMSFLLQWKKTVCFFTIYLFSHRKSFRFVRCVNNRGIRLTRTNTRTRTSIVENEFHKVLNGCRAISTLLIIIDTAPPTDMDAHNQQKNGTTLFAAFFSQLLSFARFLSFRIYFRLSED